MVPKSPGLVHIETMDAPEANVDLAVINTRLKKEADTLAKTAQTVADLSKLVGSLDKLIGVAASFL